MRTIWKYVFRTVDGPQNASIPKGSICRFVGIDPESGDPAVWFEAQSEFERETRTFIVRGTGHAISAYENYVGSTIQGVFVWHIFEATL